MNKKRLLSFALIILTYLIPILLLFHYQNSAIEMGKRQIPLLSILFLGATLLSYINWKKENRDLLGSIFRVLGVLGFLLSGATLLLLFSFRNCCGF